MVSNSKQTFLLLFLSAAVDYDNDGILANDFSAALSKDENKATSVKEL